MEELINNEELLPTSEPTMLETMGGDIPLQEPKMLVVYFLDDGEIYEVFYGYSSLEEAYGAHRGKQFGQILGGLALDGANDYVFNRKSDFIVDVKSEVPQLAFKPSSMELYNIFKHTRVMMEEE